MADQDYQGTPQPPVQPTPQAAPQQTAYQAQYQTAPQPQQVQQPMAQAPVTDSGSFGWAVLGFFFPIVGLVLFLVWRQTKPKCAKMAGIGALVGFILQVIGSISSTAFMAAMLPYYY